MWKDPIVEEVRAARQKIAAECGYDLKKILERDREVLKQWKGKVVTKEELMKQRGRTRSASQQK
ncbi:MAG: hypothetical protein FJ279_32965 [Planctomycetes bacterium]|nr:hypothetical protein [Planctomycetota bacterium]